MRSFEALTRERGILYGGDYNPEQWAPQVWREDVALMREAGVNLVTVGVFSWATIEPSPGDLRWDWLDEVLDLLHTGGIAVDLATPSASPPPWLARLDPTTSAVDAAGVRMSVGSRNHFCPGSAVYRERVAAVVTALVARYARHPAVAMWHVGNEFGQACFCDLCADRFRTWLEARHGDLDALNRAWGTAFWSQRYADWQEVVPPRAVPYVHNPAQLLDFRRFTSDQLRDVYRLQTSVIRASSDAPVTTNAMGFFPLVDQFSWADDLDVVADDHYADPGDPSAPARAALTHDLTRGVGGGRPWALLEQAAGAVSWRPHNLPKPAGGMLRDSLRAVAHGADAVCYFQWRASTSGSERFHSAMLPHAGPDTDLHRDVREQGRLLARLRPVVGTRVDARVALVFDWPSLWAAESDSLPSTRLTVPDQLAAYHEPFWRAGIATDVVPPGADLDRYDLVVVPLLHLVSDADAANLARVAERGGVLLVGPFSGISDEDQRIRSGRFPVPWAHVLGASGEQHRPLPAEGVEVHSARYGTFTATVWSEHLAADGAEVLATYESAGLTGRPAVLRNGTAWYVSTVPPADVLRAIVADCLGAAGIEPPLATIPDGVEVARRGELLFVLNHGDSAAALPGDGVDLLTGAPVVGTLHVPAGGAVVLAARGSGAGPGGQDGREEAGLGGLLPGEPTDRHVDRDGADGVRGDVDRGQGLGLAEGHVLRAHGHDRDVPGHVLAVRPQGLQHGGQRDLVVHDDRGDVRQRGEHLVDGLDGAGVRRLAGLEDGVEAQPGGLLREAADQARRVGGAPAQHRPRGADERDLPVTETGQVVDGHPAHGLEVQVDAGEPGGVARQTDQDRGLLLSAQDRQPGVLGLDVHHQHGVDHRAGRHPLDALVVVLREQQDVVLVGLGARDDAGDELHDHADVDVDAQRRHEREHLGALRGERAGARVRPVVQLADGPLHPGAGLGGDGPLAGERVGHGGDGDPRHPRHVVDRRHHAIPSSAPAGPTLASRTAVETAVGAHPSWTPFAQTPNVISASKRFDADETRSLHPKAPR